MSESINQRLGKLSDKRDANELRPLFEELVTLEGSATWDAGSIDDGNEEAKEITVTGAALGDFVLVSASIDTTDLALTAQVTAANTVTALLLNNTGGAINLASMTVYVRVLPLASRVI
jgi:hypothetical protein